MFIFSSNGTLENFSKDETVLIPRGFLQNLTNYFKEHNIPFIIQDNRFKKDPVKLKPTFKHLSEGHFGDLKEEQKQILSLVNQSNANALRLVTNLLSVFKYESKSYKLLLETIEISELLNK